MKPERENLGSRIYCSQIIDQAELQACLQDLSDRGIEAEITESGQPYPLGVFASYPGGEKQLHTAIVGEGKVYIKILDMTATSSDDDPEGEIF